jgi:GT2 family glycosyltransferase
MYLEDADFAYRSRLAGVKAIFVPAARVYHHLSATSGGELSSYLVGRNTIWTLVKNVPSGLWRRYGLKIVAGQLRIALDALAAIRGAEARARLQGMLAGVVGLPSVLSKRRVIQAKRSVHDDDLTALLEE